MSRTDRLRAINASVDPAPSLSGYARPNIVAALAPVDLPRIRDRIADDVRSNRAATDLWTYSDKPIDLPRPPDRRELEALPSELVDAIRATVESDRESVEVLRSRDDALVTAWSAERYPRPNDAERREVERILASGHETVDDGSTRLDADALGERMRRVLDSLELREWAVRVTPNLTADASVNARSRRLSLRAGAAFTSADANRLIAHEIGGHVLRAVNASRQPHPVAAFPLGDTTETDEGLALVTEELLGVAAPQVLRRYALRMRAVDVAEVAGVLGVVRELVDFAPLDVAVNTAIRVKRGLRDPNQPGGMFKDSAYLRGRARVRALVAGDPSAYEHLYATKWSADHLDLLPVAHAQGLVRLEDLVLPDSGLLAVV